LLQIFFFKQTYMAGEWIWTGFEGKTLAYLFIFWSIYYLLHSKYLKMAVFAAIATYCHVLVGGWYFVGISIYLLLSGYVFRKTLTNVLIYALITLPFIAYLAYFILSGDGVESVPTANWIYVFFRNRHHLVPTTKGHFWQNEWPFIALMIISLIFLFKKWFKNEQLNKIARLVVSYNIILLLGIILTYIDTQGAILKYYVLRMSSISLLLELLLVTLIVIHYFRLDIRWNKPTAIAQYISLSILLYFGISNNIEAWQTSSSETAYWEFVEFVKENTEGTDKFCFINYKDKHENVRFINDANRDRLVSYKMVPEGDNAILEWYNRIQLREEVSNDLHKFKSLSSTYQLSFLVSKIPVASDDLKSIYSNELYYVYQQK